MKPQERMAAIFRAPGLDTESAIVAMAIASHLADDDDAECWPSVARLCEMTRLGERTVQQVIGWAASPEVGWLTLSQRPGCMRKMRIDWARLADAEKPDRPCGARKSRANIQSDTPARGAPPDTAVGAIPAHTEATLADFATVAPPTAEPPHGAHPRTGRTGAPAAPAHGARLTPARGAPKPTSDPTTERERSDARVNGSVVILRPTPPALPAEPPIDDPPELTPDGRPLPRTLLELLGGRMDLVRTLYDSEQRISTPKHLLTIESDQVRFIRGMGGLRVKDVAQLCEDAGFPLGCCCPQPETGNPNPTRPPGKRRKRPDFDGWTDDEKNEWGESGMPLDADGAPIKVGSTMAAVPGNLSTIPLSKSAPREARA